MSQMTVSAALAELKMLDKRIEKSVTSDDFVGMAYRNEAEDAWKKREEFCRSNFQSTQALINRARRIKRALTLSNATKQVTVGGDTMTVAEAIEMKNRIQHYRLFAAKVGADWSRATANTQRQKGELEVQATKLFANGQEVDLALVDAYVKAREPFIVGVKNGDEEARKLMEFVEVFERDIDEALNVANATTTIEVGDN